MLLNAVCVVFLHYESFHQQHVIYLDYTYFRKWTRAYQTVILMKANTGMKTHAFIESLGLIIDD